MSFAGFTFNDYLWVFLPLIGLVGCIVLSYKTGSKTESDELTPQQHASNNLAFGMSLAGMAAALVILIIAWSINAPRAHLQAQLEAEGYAVAAVRYGWGDGTATVILGSACPLEADVVFHDDGSVKLFSRDDTRRLHPLTPSASKNCS